MPITVITPDIYTYVDENFPDTHFGNQVGVRAGKNARIRGWSQFDLSTVSTYKIVSANISVTFPYPNEFQIFNIQWTDDFNFFEGTSITWNNAPKVSSYTTSFQSGSPLGPVTVNNIDVTHDVMIVLSQDYRLIHNFVERSVARDSNDALDIVWEIWFQNVTLTVKYTTPSTFNALLLAGD